MGFIDRIVQFPGRVTLTDVNSGTSQTVDVVRSEGTVTEAGTLLNATNLNTMTQVDAALETEFANYINGQYTDFDNYQNSMSDLLALLLHGVRVHNYGQWNAIELVNSNKDGKYTKIAWSTQKISVANTTASTAYGGYRSPNITVSMPNGLFDETPTIALGTKNSANSIRLMNVAISSKNQLAFYTSSAESVTATIDISFLVIGKGSYTGN